MRRCIILSSLFQTFPESKQQILNPSVGKTYLVESIIFATLCIAGIESPSTNVGYIVEN